MLFLVILITSVISLRSQPGYIKPFDPNAGCMTSGVDSIFYGQVISVELFKENPKTILVFENNGAKHEKQAFGKMTVQIKKKFKGNIKNLAEIYLGPYIKYEPQPQQSQDLLRKGLEAVFLAQKADSGKLYLFQRSVDMSDYNSDQKQFIISSISLRLKLNPKSGPILGMVVRKLGPQDPYSPELASQKGMWNYSRFRLFAKDFAPLFGITVEAKQMDSKKVFRTTTDGTGRFVFRSLPKGFVYRIQPVSSGSSGELYADYDLTLDRDACYGALVFDVK